MMLNPGVLTPLGEGGWEAEVVHLPAVGTAVDVAQLGPHVYDSSCSRLRFRPAMLLVVVVAGRLEGTAGGDRFEVLPDQALLLDTRQALHSRVEESVRLVRVVVDQRRLLHPLLGRDPLYPVVLADSPVLGAAVGAARAVLERSEALRVPDDESAIADLVTGIQRSVLTESVRQGALSWGGDGSDTYSRICQDIGQHLADVDLSPVVIAHRLRVSVRTVHAAFVGRPRTVAAEIRARRVGKVLEAMYGLDRFPRLDEVAFAFGFHSAAHLSRSVLTETGVPLSTWFERQDQRPTQ